jgi:hypothetical protein
MVILCAGCRVPVRHLTASCVYFWQGGGARMPRLLLPVARCLRAAVVCSCCAGADCTTGVAARLLTCRPCGGCLAWLYC